MFKMNLMYIPDNKNIELICTLFL